MIQGSEFFIILLVALVVMGPQRLPEMARKVGHWTAELRRTAADLRAGLEAEVADFQEISRELKAPLGEITTVARETAEAANDVVKPVSPGGPRPKQAGEGSGGAGTAGGDDLHGEPLAWTGPTPASGPTADDALADLEEIERSGEPLTDTRPEGAADGEEEPEAGPETSEDAAADEPEQDPARPNGRHEATG